MEFYIGFIALLVCALAARIISEKAFKLLDGEQKVEVLDAFSGMRKWSLVPLIIIFLMFALGDCSADIASTVINISAFVGILVHLLIMHFLVRKKINELSVPGDYKRKLMIARWVSYAGIGFLVAFLVLL